MDSDSNQVNVDNEIVKQDRKSRLGLICPIFGAPVDLRLNDLPVNTDVITCYLLTRNNLKRSQSCKEPDVCVVAEKVAEKVEELWERASIPCILHKSVIRKAVTLHDT